MTHKWNGESQEQRIYNTHSHIRIELNWIIHSSKRMNMLTSSLTQHEKYQQQQKHLQEQHNIYEVKEKKEREKFFFRPLRESASR